VRDQGKVWRWVCTLGLGRERMRWKRIGGVTIRGKAWGEVSVYVIVIAMVSLCRVDEVGVG
jgi:hypothetical protein